MTVYDALFAGDTAIQLVNLVHEQAHVWDDTTNGAMSENMMNATGSYYSWRGFQVNYVAVGETSSEYLTYHYEDWAETVAAAIYPTHPRFAYPDGKPRMGEERKNYIRSFLPNGAIFES